MQETFLSQIDDLPPIAIKLLQYGISQRKALEIANQEWDALDPTALPKDRADFDLYVDEKIRLAQRTNDIDNLAGFIIKAIRENYQDPKLEKQLQAEKAREREAILKTLKDETLEKQNALLRQAVRANPQLLEQAAVKITSRFVQERLENYDSISDAYHAGSVVAGEINAILAAEFCQDLLAPTQATYEDEKARIY